MKKRYAFTGYRICFVPGHLKYNIVRLHARRLASATPCKRIPAVDVTDRCPFNPVNGYKKRRGTTGLALTACIAFLTFAVAALASATVTLEVEVNDNFQLVDGDGRIYDVADTEKGNKLVDKHVGDKVKVTGTIEQDEEQNLIFVTDYEVMAE